MPQEESKKRKRVIAVSFSPKVAKGAVDSTNTIRNTIINGAKIDASKWSENDFITRYSEVYQKGDTPATATDFLKEITYDKKDPNSYKGLDSIITIAGNCNLPDETDEFVYKSMGALNFDFGSTKVECYASKALKNFSINSSYLKNRYGSIGGGWGEESKFPMKNKDHRRTRVFVFLKVLVGKKGEESIGTSIVDLTEHLESLEYMKTHDGSKMIVNLAHKIRTYREGEINRQNYKGGDMTKLTQNQSLYDSNIEDGIIRAKTFAYNISVNDVVLSTDEDFEPSRSYDYDPNNITPEIFWRNIKSLNFIGLVDFPTSISETYNLRSSIACSDLSKLLTIDGTYWYMLGKGYDSGGVFTGTNKNSDADRGLFNDETYDYKKDVEGRFLPSGKLYDMMNFQNRNILEFLKFIIGNLTNLEICPSSSILVDKK